MNQRKSYVENFGACDFTIKSIKDLEGRKRCQAKVGCVISSSNICTVDCPSRKNCNKNPECKILNNSCVPIKLNP